MISNSLRNQLTLWYTGVLAVILIAFAIATYEYLARAAAQRTDTSLTDTANVFISTLITESVDEHDSLDHAAVEAAASFHVSDQQVVVYDEGRRPVAASNPPVGYEQWQSSAAAGTAIVEVLNAIRANGRGYATVPDANGGLRLFGVAAKDGPRTFAVVIAHSLRAQTESLKQVRHAFYAAIPVALLLAALGGYFLARKSLAPVIAMSNQAARIGVTTLNERLPVADSHNELSELARIFNDLLARLDSSFEQQRRFMADASHELRTPVAIVCGESEVALSRAERSRDEYRQSLKIVHEEGKRLTRVVEDLFTLARADAGQYPLVLANLYLDEAISDCLRSVRSLALQRGLDLCFDAPDKEMPFRGDEALLRRLMLNLLDNSIKHTLPGGRITVDLRQEDHHYSILVADTGQGIPVEVQSHVFERFFRADKARSRDAGTNGSGAGLGLSIASWIAQMHGGRIVLDHSDQSGTTFIISLPLVY